jgi:UDP-N-acetylmuramate--alanine ligase
VAGRLDPVFVDDIARMPQAIADFVRDGDVVITMGAGSIGTVPQKLRDLLAGAVSASAAAQAPVPGGRA